DFDGRRDAARVNEFRLVGGELAYRRQRAVHEQIRNLLEFADIGDVEDVVAAVMQIVACAPDGAKLGVAGNDAGKRDRFLRLGNGSKGFVHRVLSATYRWFASQITRPAFVRNRGNRERRITRRASASAPRRSSAFLRGVSFGRRSAPWRSSHDRPSSNR